MIAARDKRLTVIASSISLLLVITLGLSVWYATRVVNDFNGAMRVWTEYSAGAEKKQSYISSIQHGLGPDGLIQGFRNALLRTDIVRLENVQTSVKILQYKILLYEEIGNKQEVAALNVISAALEDYLAKAEVARDAILSGLTAIEMDRLARVDDAAALDALSTLQENLKLSQLASEDGLNVAAQNVKRWIPLGVILLSLLVITGIGFFWVFRLLIKEMNGHHAAAEKLRKYKAGLERLVDERTAELELILDNATIGIAYMKNRTLIRVHRNFEELFGWASEELIGYGEDAWRQVGEDYRRFSEEAIPVIEAGVVFEGEYQFKKKDGSRFWCRILGQAMDAKSPDEGCIWLVEDVGNRKVVEQTLIRARKDAEAADRSKTEFLANMSHELRSPLNSIIGFAETIKKESFGPVGLPQYVEYAGDILDSGLHLLDLINDILDVSVIETGNLQLDERLINIGSLLSTCSRLVQQRAKKAGLDLEIEMPTTHPSLYADERRLKQILINLLTNSIKFTPAGGTISLRAYLDTDGCYVFEVADTGIGIAEEEMEEVMAPFGQADSSLDRKYEGTGLGLPLVKSLTELHAGTMSIRSEVDLGTTARIRLPRSRTRHAA